VAVLLAIELLDELVGGSRAAAWPLIRHDLHLGYAEIGLVLALPGLFGSALDPVIGLAGDTRRRGALMLAGGIGFAVSAALSAAAVGFWTLLPVAGTFVGALPIVLFAGAASTTRAVVVGLAFVAIGIGEYVLTSYTERQTVEVGSFLIVLAAFGGLELYGLTGALLGVLGVIVLVAILDELRRADEEVLVEESELLITPPRE